MFIFIVHSGYQSNWCLFILRMVFICFCKWTLTSYHQTLMLHFSLISLRWAGLHFIRPSECTLWPKASCMCVCFFPDNINKYKYKPCGRQVCQCLLCKYTVNANSTPPGSALYWKPFRERQIEMTEQFWDYLQRWRCIHLTKGDTELYCKYVQRFNLNFLTKKVSIMWSNFNLSSLL